MQQYALGLEISWAYSTNPEHHTGPMRRLLQMDGEADQ